MRALVGIGICKEENPGTYEHNERSRTLLDRDFCTLITGMYAPPPDDTVF